MSRAKDGEVDWYKWGPYLSERQWGTVREDTSDDGNAWASFPHDHARSRAYRWERGLFLPLFVPCLIVGILLSNLLPKPGPKFPFRWPSRTPAIDLIAEISLGAFLAMSLMTIQFWTLVDLAGPLLLILIT